MSGSSSIFSSWWRILYLVLSAACLAATGVGLAAIFSVGVRILSQVLFFQLFSFVVFGSVLPCLFVLQPVTTEVVFLHKKAKIIST